MCAPILLAQATSGPAQSRGAGLGEPTRRYVSLGKLCTRQTLPRPAMCHSEPPGEESLWDRSGSRSAKEVPRYAARNDTLALRRCVPAQGLAQSFARRPRMKPVEIARMRLSAQRISATAFRRPDEVVAWL